MPINENHSKREDIAIVPDDTVMLGIEYTDQNDDGTTTQIIDPTWGKLRDDAALNLEDLADCLRYAASLIRNEQHIAGAQHLAEEAANHLLGFITHMLSTMHAFEHIQDQLGKQMGDVHIPDGLPVDLEALLGNDFRLPSQRH